MKPLHPQVRISALPGNRLAYVELYDGRLWLRAHTQGPLLLRRAEQRARWLSDVLEHARRAALEEAARSVEAEWWGYEETQSIAADIRGLKVVRDGRVG